ncbi:unnamed protein product [Caenorhabditis sp. 36 PRJEB53466]|nr:unnamed protein product [Caenorhabditis sp. 36 PRJEB53466]
MKPEDFAILKVLGKGGYGKVYQARKITGRDKGSLFAMKAIKKNTIRDDEKFVEHMMAERNILENVNSPFLCELHYAFQTVDKLYLIMEYISGGDLFARLERVTKFSESAARFYLAEVLLAIQHLHSNGVIYRDLKPDNIMLDQSGHVKLTDFGLCKANLGHDELTDTFCGTIEYMAPEVLEKRQYGRAADYWALGILLYDMLSGCSPFYTSNRKKTMMLIKKAEFPMINNISPEAKSLLRKLIHRNEKTRLGASGTKSHSFFGKTNWLKMEAREVEPPFRPCHIHEEDVSNFDSAFTSMAPEESPCKPECFVQDDDLFVGFDYVRQEDETFKAPLMKKCARNLQASISRNN